MTNSCNVISLLKSKYIPFDKGTETPPWNLRKPPEKSFGKVHRINRIENMFKRRLESIPNFYQF